MSARQTYLPSKQKSHYGEEDGQDEENVRGAHHCVVGEFIWLSSNLVDVEANWEDESSHTEEDHPCEGNPAGVSGGLASPVWHHQQPTGDSEGDDAQDDEEESGDPLWGQLWGDAGPISAVDGLALLNQTHSQRAGWFSGVDPVWVGDAGDGEDVCSEEETSWDHGQFIHDRGALSVFASISPSQTGRQDI